MNLLDTHFHLDLWSSPVEILNSIEKNRVYTIAVTNTPSVFKFTENITKNSKYTNAALGLHPELVFERHGELPLFHELINKTRYIGEIGLDYSVNDKANHRLQRKVFESIIEGCKNSNEKKVLTIHSRRAEKDVIDTIGSSFPGKAILHWYSGSHQELRRAVGYGFYFSINSAMLRSKSGQRTIYEIPHDRILTESDGPFILDSHGHQVSPLHINNTISQLAKILKEESHIIRRLIYSNFKTLLNHVV